MFCHRLLLIASVLSAATLNEAVQSGDREAVRALLKKHADGLPSKLKLDSARRLAEPRLKALRGFLAAAAAEIN